MTGRTSSGCSRSIPAWKARASPLALAAHSKQFRLSIVVVLRIFVCSNLCFSSDFNIVLAEDWKHLHLKNSISIGIDEVQRANG